jgi:predicted N-acetyltransferase YhbS
VLSGASLDGGHYAVHYLTDRSWAIAQIAACLADEWPDRWPGAQAADRLGVMLQRHRLPIGLVAFDDHERPAGFAGITVGTTPGRDDVAVLMPLYVAPAHRHRRLGAHLCAQAASTAGRLGWNRIAAYTEDHPTFFARIGWRLITQATITSEPGNQRVWYFERHRPDEDDRVAVVAGGEHFARSYE